VTIRLYLDDDCLAKGLVKALRSDGVDVVTAQEAGIAGYDDEEHLAYATEQGRVLYSFNRGDFLRLNKQWLEANRSHAGIILAAQQRYGIGEQKRRIMKVINGKSAEDMMNCVEFLNRWG